MSRFKQGLAAFFLWFSVPMRGFLPKVFASDNWYCTVRKIRSEDVELPVIHAYKQETIIILDRTNNFDERFRRNKDNCLMVVSGEHHHRKSQEILPGHNSIARRLH